MATTMTAAKRTESHFPELPTGADSSNKTTTNQGKAFGKTVFVIAAFATTCFLSAIAGYLSTKDIPLATREAGPAATLLYAASKTLPVCTVITGVFCTWCLSMLLLTNRFNRNLGMK